MRESWKKIEGVVGYEVSNRGRVRSFWLNRYLKDSPQKVLNPVIGNHGYFYVRLNGAVKLVHRLVLTAFRGKSKLYGCHNDGNKLNNVLSNLRWDTQAGNMKDRERHGTKWIGNKNPLAKLSMDLAQKIREEHKLGNISGRALARKYGVTEGTIRPLLAGKTWGDY
jgi:hypothetical protein